MKRVSCIVVVGRFSVPFVLANVGADMSTLSPVLVTFFGSSLVIFHHTYYEKCRFFIENVQINQYCCTFGSPDDRLVLGRLYPTHIWPLRCHSAADTQKKYKKTKKM